MKTKKTRPLFGGIIFAFVVLGLVGCTKSHASVKQLGNFLYLSSNDLSIADTDKKAICSLLEKYYFEKNNEGGFAIVDGMNCTFYSASHLVEMVKLLGNSDLINQLRINFSMLSECDISNYSLYDLLQYSEICMNLGLPFDQAKVLSLLERFYVEDEAVFFATGDITTVNANVDLYDSIWVVSLFGEKLGDERLEKMRETASRLMKEKKFTGPKDGKAFYNSGGYILWYCDCLGLDYTEKLPEITDWFEKWKTEFESTEPDDIVSFTNYAGYADIFAILYNEYPVKKFMDLYEKLKPEDLKDIDDMQYYYTFFEKVPTMDNMAVNDKLLSILKNKIENQLFSKNIDVYATAYGVALAKECGFQYDADKINNYLLSQYGQVKKEKSSDVAIKNLYYLVAADYMVNGEEKHIYTSSVIRKILNKAINKLEFTQDTLANDISIVRRVSEIISLTGADGEIGISNRQVEAIRAGIKQALQDDTLVNSAGIVDMKIIDYIFNLNLVDDSVLQNTYQKLQTADGVKKYDTEDSLPCLESTYSFFILSELDSVFDEDQTTFAEKFEIDNGIYFGQYGFADITFKSIYEGNVVNR